MHKAELLAFCRSNCHENYYFSLMIIVVDGTDLQKKNRNKRRCCAGAAFGVNVEKLFGLACIVSVFACVITLESFKEFVRNL